MCSSFCLFSLYKWQSSVQLSVYPGLLNTNFKCLDWRRTSEVGDFFFDNHKNDSQVLVLWIKKTTVSEDSKISTEVCVFRV